jgi:DNA-binding NtrC family response regulator
MPIGSQDAAATAERRSSGGACSSPPPLWLVGFGSDPGGCWRLGDTTTIGRDSRNDVVHLDDAMSRHHALIEFEAGAARIRDLGGRNGTSVNGRRIAEAQLHAGDVIRCGDTLFRVVAATEPWQPADCRGPLVGGSALTSVRRLISLVGPTDMPVFISGETGTGKEVVARLLHQASPRSGPFVPINCAAIPESMIESELFGHVRGAFTGAHAARPGLFATATGGTLFLDEVGELPLAAQAKLLRVLEDGVIRPLGSELGAARDVRVLSATNRNLRQAMSDDAFRPDLFARLCMVEIELPALRDHPEDLPAIAEYLLRRASIPARLIAPDALEAMALYRWPQNIRELDHILRQATLRPGAELTLDALPRSLIATTIAASSPQLGQIATMKPSGDTTGDMSGDLQVDLRQRLEGALRRHRGNVRRASQELNISRGHVYRLIQKWSIAVTELRKRKGT